MLSYPHAERSPRRATSPDHPRGSFPKGLCWGVAAMLSLGASLGAVTALQARAHPVQSRAQDAGRPTDRPTLADAQLLFYSARYEEAAALALALRSAEPEDLANDELRTSALLFQLKGLLQRPADKGVDKVHKEEALRTCATCGALIAAFLEDLHHGQALARARLLADPDDDSALFFLGKLDLNYVWLQLGTLGRRTGWDEYREARRSLDAVLTAHPHNVRALVARGWIEYIVSTRMPWGTRWLFGGGNRKRALKMVHDATLLPSDVFSHAEAEFALWNMLVREGDMIEATEVARRLARDFPANRELAAFLEARQAPSRR